MQYVLCTYNFSFFYFCSRENPLTLGGEKGHKELVDLLLTRFVLLYPSILTHYPICDQQNRHCEKLSPAVCTELAWYIKHDFIPLLVALSQHSHHTHSALTPHILCSHTAHSLPTLYIPASFSSDFTYLEACVLNKPVFQLPTPSCILRFVKSCWGRSRGFDGFGSHFSWVTLALSKTYPKNPENDASDVPDFKIFPGKHAPEPPRLSRILCSQIWTPTNKILVPPQSVSVLVHSKLWVDWHTTSFIRNANVECHTKKGCTPFFLASREGHLEIAVSLMKNKANTEVSNFALCRVENCNQRVTNVTANY